MTREEFEGAAIGQVKKYIYEQQEMGENCQIRVNPELLYVDLLTNRELQQGIGFSDEVIENAAYAEGDETMSSEDYQAKQDPDFYPVDTLVRKVETGELEPDFQAIGKLVDRYFR